MTMTTTTAPTERFLPGVRTSRHLDAGSRVVAAGGALRLRYRDRSLDGLLDLAPQYTHLLQEGECHVMAAAALVELEGLGPEGAQAAILPPERALARLGHWLREALARRQPVLRKPAAMPLIDR